MRFFTGRHPRRGASTLPPDCRKTNLVLCLIRYIVNFFQILYTYPENFRAYKALIAAQFSGTQIKVAEDFVFGETNKSEAFLKKFPLGKVSKIISKRLLLLELPHESFSFSILHAVQLTRFSSSVTYDDRDYKIFCYLFGIFDIYSKLL